MTSEVDCPNCKAGLDRIYRFKTLRHLAIPIVLAIGLLLFLGVMSSYIALQVLLPVMLLALAGRIWDDTNPILQCRKLQESDNLLNPDYPLS